MESGRFVRSDRRPEASKGAKMKISCVQCSRLPRHPVHYRPPYIGNTFKVLKEEGRRSRRFKSIMNRNDASIMFLFLSMLKIKV